MSVRPALPFGTWPSSITSEMLTRSSVRLADTELDAQSHTLYWIESRPEEGGRYVVRRVSEAAAFADGGPAEADVEEVTAGECGDAGRANARTRVHEYGGGALCVGHGRAIFAHFKDQRLYEGVPQPGGGARIGAITAAGPLRYADGDVAAGDKLVAVVEDHSRPTTAEVENRVSVLDLGAVGADGSAFASERVVARGADFYSSPRVSPDGRWLAYVRWFHPNMPWCVAAPASARALVLTRSLARPLSPSPTGACAGTRRSCASSRWTARIRTTRECWSPARRRAWRRWSGSRTATCCSSATAPSGGTCTGR